jgi:carbon-monoxide dehydrogenase iron sulfur subunit
MRRKTRDVARSMSTGVDQPSVPAGVALLKSIKQSELQLSGS